MRNILQLFALLLVNLCSLEASLTPYPDTSTWSIVPYKPPLNCNHALRLAALLHQEKAYPFLLNPHLERSQKVTRAVYELFLKPPQESSPIIELLFQQLPEALPGNKATITVSKSYIGKLLEKGGVEIFAKEDLSSWHAKQEDDTSLFLLSPSGNLMAFPAGTYNEHLFIFKTKNAERVAFLEGEKNLSLITGVFSPDEKYIATITKERVNLWNLETQKPLFEKQLIPYIKTLCFTPSGRSLVILSKPLTGSTISIFNLETQKTISTFLPESYSQNLELNHTGRVALITAPISLYLGDLAKNILINTITRTKVAGTSKGLEHYFQHATLHPFLPLVATILNNQQGLYFVDFTGNKIEPVSLDKYLTNAAFSPDGETLYAGTTDGQIVCWDISHFEKTATIVRVKTLLNLVKKYKINDISSVPKGSVCHKLLKSLPHYLRKNKKALFTLPIPF